MASAEEKKLLGALSTLGAPQTDDQAKLEKWMLEHLAAKGKVPKEEKGSRPVVESKSTYSPQLRISTFSGERASKDTPFDLWIFEVKALVKDKEYSEATIQQAVRRSLKGEAARCVMRMTESASLAVVLNKLEAVFGKIESSESLMAEFYSIHQKSDEDVASWGCRLEDILDRAKHHGWSGSILEANKVLKNRFWNGLTQKLKDVSRHKYETVADFDKLRTEMRVIENEYQLLPGNSGESEKLAKKVAQIKMATSADAESTGSEGGDMKELKGIIHKLSHQVERMEKQINQRTQNYGKPNGKPSGRPQDTGLQASGGGDSSSGHSEKVNDGSTGSQGDDSSSKGRIKCWNCRGFGHHRDVCPSKKVFECFYCHEVGHRKFECPKNPDKSGDLNASRPSSGGRRW